MKENDASHPTKRNQQHGSSDKNDPHQQVTPQQFNAPSPTHFADSKKQRKTATAIAVAGTKIEAEWKDEEKRRLERKLFLIGV